MFCSKDCKHPNGNYSYVFVEENATLQVALKNCEKKNGTLAQNINFAAYKNLNSCCNSTNVYRIGLVNNNTCLNSSKKLYHWVGKKRCRSARPLLVKNKPNESGCQTIGITVKTPSVDLSHAYVHNCDQEMYYICQIRQPKFFLLSEPFQPLRNDNIIADAPSTTSTSVTQATVNAGLIGGVIGGLSAVVALLVILICWQIRNQRSSNILKRKSTKKLEEHIYSKYVLLIGHSKQNIIKINCNFFKIFHV